MPPGGKRPGAGRPKGSTKPPQNKQTKVTTELRQKVLDRLVPLVTVLLDNCEKGILNLVLVGRNSARTVPAGEAPVRAPRGTEKTHSALKRVKDLCPRCGRAELDDTEIYEGWTSPPPVADIKWIVETFVGKAPTQAPPEVDAGTRFVFPDGMDCLPGPSEAAMPVKSTLGLPD